MDEKAKRFAVLNSLPAYGPMHVSITDDGHGFWSEGVVVRFYKADGTDWVANFKPGWTSKSEVFDFPQHDCVIVVAGGLAYVMNPESEKPITTFGLTINEIFQTADGGLVCANGISLLYLDSLTGDFYESERISWDGFKDLKLAGDVVSGKSYQPMSEGELWTDFSLNLKTREVIGGSYRESLVLNPHIAKNHLQNSSQNKPWWKIW